MTTLLRTGAGMSLRTSKSITFTGAANLGAIGNVPLFTTTGEVAVVYLVPFIVLTLAGAGATLALGVANSTALFIAATLATNLATGEFWTESTGGGTAEAGIALPAALKEIVISSNIVGTAAVAAITGGTLRLDVYYLPLSSDGTLVPA